MSLQLPKHNGSFSHSLKIFNTSLAFGPSSNCTIFIINLPTAINKFTSLEYQNKAHRK